MASMEVICQMIAKGKNYLANNSGNNLYTFERGQGINVIKESGGYDTIEFTSPDITRENFQLLQDGNSLMLGAVGDSDAEIELETAVVVAVLNNLEPGKEVEAIRIPGYQLTGEKISQLAQMMSTTLTSEDNIQQWSSRNNIQTTINALWTPVQNQQ